MKGKGIILQEKGTRRNLMFSMLINLDARNDTAEELYLQRESLRPMIIEVGFVSERRLSDPNHTVIGVFNVSNK